LSIRLGVNADAHDTNAVDTIILIRRNSVIPSKQSYQIDSRLIPRVVGQPNVTRLTPSLCFQCDELIGKIGMMDYSKEYLPYSKANDTMQEIIRY
jgi:hypothetical protein